jgi:hypothetical protein
MGLGESTFSITSAIDHAFGSGISPENNHIKVFLVQKHQMLAPI